MHICVFLKKYHHLLLARVIKYTHKAKILVTSHFKKMEPIRVAR